MGNLRETRIATMEAMLDGLLDSVEHDYVFAAAVRLVKRARTRLRDDRAILSEWRRAEDCYLRAHGDLGHDGCDWCNLGGSRLADHQTYMRGRAVELKAKAGEVMKRRKWDSHGRAE